MESKIYKFSNCLSLMSIFGGEKISLKTDEMMEILGRQEVLTMERSEVVKRKPRLD